MLLRILVNSWLKISLLLKNNFHLFTFISRKPSLYIFIYAVLRIIDNIKQKKYSPWFYLFIIFYQKWTINISSPRGNWIYTPKNLDRSEAFLSLWSLRSFVCQYVTVSFYLIYLLICTIGFKLCMMIFSTSLFCLIYLSNSSDFCNIDS